ncbi:MAG TPA: M13 family metallopeptidase [Steroidobacteraceae bacterium]|jgi:predicted metalloendopeptidase|nr:M13 family metallopeptidase [Steroidobacteraceae bacterium]
MQTKTAPWVILLLFAAGAAAPLTMARADAIHSGKTGVDESIRPGDDFFAFANGEWLAATQLPAGKERWGARAETDALTRQQVADLLEGAATAPPGSLGRKVSDFRAAWLDEAAIEARGLKSIMPLLERIDRIRDQGTLTEVLAQGMRADVDPLNWGVYDSAHLLGLSVEEGNHGEKDYVAYLLQGGLGLPDRDQYLNAAPESETLRTKYREYIGRMLGLAGFDHAQQRADAVMALETAIAQSHATHEASANDHNSDNLWTRADFAREAPGMDWAAFLAAAGLAKQETFVVWQPGAVKGAAALVASQKIDAWKDYLRFHLIDANAELLPRAFAAQAFALHGTAVSGQQQPDARAQRATDATQKGLGEALGRLYVEKYFPAERKARVEAIGADVLSAFRQRVQSVTWMSPETRAKADAKLQNLYLGVGYPDKWSDYAGLTVDPRDASGNLLRVEQWNYRNALAQLGKPVDRKEWGVAPQSVGAVLMFQLNAYNFAAALLQPPKFDAAASEAATYGAIGAILGHDISHFVDTIGAEYDVDGAAHRWWTAADLANYQRVTEPLVKQYSSYRPFPDLSLDGKLTLVENLADLGGLNAAFDAHRRALGARVSDQEFVRQQDRQFFIAFAQAWRARIREDALRKQAASNDHAPEMYRFSTVRNLDAWYDAFDVRPGQRLYLPPDERVRIW